MAEPNETVNIILNYPNKAMLGAPSVHTYTIVDDDGPLTAVPVVGFASSTSTGAENSSPALIPVVLSRASDLLVTVAYATTAGGTASSGADYTALDGTLTFNPGETVKTLSLPVLNDGTAESSETVVLTLGAVSNALASTSSAHTFTITDDDVPVVTIAASSPTAVEGEAAGVFTFTRTGATTSGISVNFTRAGTATSGTDFTAFSPPTSIIIPAGQQSVDLFVLTGAIADTTPEVDETVILTLAAGTGYVPGTPAAATVVIVDDDVNTITLVASDAVASEAGGNPGALTLSRTGPVTAARSVTLSVSGTASSGTDYTAFTTSPSFAVGQSTLTIPVTILPDSLTEGDEEIVVSISTSSSYIVGSPSVANITILDDDLPPTVFINSPASKATIIATGNGLLLEATAADDGLPSPLTYTWSRLFGPGTVTFENPAAATTGVTFSAPGVHGLRITVNDGQFSATDDVFVESGGFAYANWVSQDQGPPSVRGVAGQSDSSFTLIGSGTGYSATNDSGHMLFRQLLGGTGDATMVARLSSLTGPATRLAGITLRDTSWKGARRVNLLLDGAGTVQFRSRATANAADAATSATGLSSPLWLRLERTGATITASTAPDAGGVPGAWTQRGVTSAVSMGSNVVVGMVVSSGASTTASSTAVFDNVTVTPPFTGGAVHSEDIGNYVIAGGSSVSGGITSINATGTYDTAGGHFRYQQVWGDCIVTARLLSQAGSTRGSQAGVSVRDTMDNGAFAFYGRTTIDGFQAHWRSVPAGGNGTLQTSGSVGNWVRIIRKGNSLSAYRAADVSGVPGTWTQATGTLPAALTGPLLVGLVVDSNSASLEGTGTFSGLTIEPLNTAPVVNASLVSSPPYLTLTTTASDDGRPNPPGAYSLAWSKAAGPGLAVFSQPSAKDTAATLSQAGEYTLRLTADDGDSRVFDDVPVAITPYAAWQQREFPVVSSLPMWDLAEDADRDGWVNLMEYAFGLSGTTPDTSPLIQDWSVIGQDRYLRISVPKNPQATDLVYEVQATSDLGQADSWTSAGLVIEADTSTLLRVRDSVPVTPGVRRFMRVKVHTVP